MSIAQHLERTSHTPQASRRPQVAVSRSVGWYGGQLSGYILLAASAVFLANVAYQSLQAQVFDAVVAGMVGAVAITSTLGISLVAVFSHSAGPEFSTPGNPDDNR
jgi:hypothetical protein